MLITTSRHDPQARPFRLEKLTYTPYIGVLFVLLAIPLIAVTDWVTLRAARRQPGG